MSYKKLLLNFKLFFVSLLPSDDNNDDINDVLYINTQSIIVGIEFIRPSVLDNFQFVINSIDITVTIVLQGRLTSLEILLINQDFRGSYIDIYSNIL